MAAPPKTTLIQVVLSDLLQFERKRLEGVLEKILQTNRKHGRSGNAFIHQGQVYSLLPICQIRGEPITEPHPAVTEDLDYYLNQKEELIRSEQRLKQGLSVVVGRCKTIQDLRNALPDILVHELPSLRGLSRTEPEGAMLESRPKLREQFEQTIDLALTFAAKRLFY